ncbi:sensor histidine kinase [Leucobacter ruminantium]|uniref:histidine kinase n=1 Tax=Leucobacter ruminantium TaxID=1289170 RepID=A0A939RYK9_9MICO|nr:ATP-binding protein [Leucobacter ruminantium]MBO1804981.1 histidine kinase [Leucobacter ruminantium]
MSRQGSSRAARIGVLLLPCLIVLVCVGVTTAIAVAVQERSVREATAERVRAVATSLAALDQVRGALSDADGDLAAATRELQPLADVVERAAGVDYVVITDDRGLRITHPSPEERGRPVSTDPSDVLAGEEFLGTETGTLGPTLRAKVPVRGPGGAIIGTLSVGILETRIAEDFDEALGRLLPWAFGSLLAGTLASSLIAAALLRRFRRFDEAARELEGVRRTAAALREQSHEFHTRLHVIHGLVSHGDTDDALAYIAEAAPVLTESADDATHDQPLLRATLEALRAELGAVGTRLETAIDVSSELGGDVTLVLANLCRNAGEAGSSLVRCALVERDGRLHGTVEDDGPGVDPKDVERVFSRGFSSKPDPSGAGRGIGLDLVRRTVAAHRGTVELGRSALGGACFRFDMGVRR